MTMIPPSTPKSAAIGPTARILVIDDSQVMLDRVAAGLTAEGYEVTTTSQTVGAARHLKGCDLVLVDFHMPGFDGATVLQSLKGAAKNTNARCLFLLYTSDEAMARRFKMHGFDGAITHKGDIGALVTQIHAIMRVVRTRAAPRAK